MAESLTKAAPGGGTELLVDIETGTRFAEIVVDPAEERLDSLHEECGVVGVSRKDVDPRLPAALANALFSIQHRGQEAAGVGVFEAGEKSSIMITKGTGLVPQALGGHELDGIADGRLGLGQVRYGTVATKGNPDAAFMAAQPAFTQIEVESKGKNKDAIDLALAHNGNLTNLEEVCPNYGLNYSDYITDSHALIDMIGVARMQGNTLEEATAEVLTQVSGAFSLVIQGEGKMIGVRDPHGFRPLMLGHFPDNTGYAFASESHTFTSLGASFLREVSRGEMIVCTSKQNLRVEHPFPRKPNKLCAFEFVYFHAPHGELEGKEVFNRRKRLGEVMARNDDVEADIVVGVPDSSLPAAEGYASISGMPMSLAIVKNRYIARTFIEPTQAEREVAVLKKLQPIVSELTGKRIVLVDDSVVRGTTMRTLVKVLKSEEVGVKEIHLRVTSAPYKYPCFFGMDTGNPDELIANRMTDPQEIADYLGVDSIRFLTTDEIREALAETAGRLCMACMDGDYPVGQAPASFEVPVRLGRL